MKWKLNCVTISLLHEQTQNIFPQLSPYYFFSSPHFIVSFKQYCYFSLSFQLFLLPYGEWMTEECEWLERGKQKTIKINCDIFHDASSSLHELLFSLQSLLQRNVILVGARIYGRLNTFAPHTTARCLVSLMIYWCLSLPAISSAIQLSSYNFILKFRW